MAFLKEIFRETQMVVSKGLFELVIPPIKLKEVQDASLQKGYGLERLGRWGGAAREFYTLSVSSENPKDRLDGLVNLSQMLINLGRFSQAKKFIKSGEVELQSLPERELFYYRARFFEKEGWIADYERDFKNAVDLFNSARRIVFRNDRTNEEEKLFSTTTHFLGRAHIGLAIQGVNSNSNYIYSLGYFKEDLERYQSLRKEGNPDPQGEGLQHAWMAVCFMTVNHLSSAEESIDRAGELFQESIKNSNPPDVMAHYHCLKGGLYLKRSLVKEARSEFNKAWLIRKAGVKYPKGEADAAIGIAVSFWMERNIKEASKWFTRAVKLYPLTLLRVRTFIA
ncbi:hypothetical protein HY404_01125 [Candidatus Microgenomates bacterium]|nr:hypothetical protein [Candidatus Microgenomates bacterium]